MQIWCCEDRIGDFVDVFQRSAFSAGYDLRLISPDGEAPAGFKKLQASYRHLSPNPENFELASLRRWFEIAVRVSPDSRFVLADSDLVICEAFCDLPVEIRDWSGLVASIGATNDVLEKGINGGFSIWSGRMLREFCEFLADTYESRVDRLAALYRAKVAAGDWRASISDMTLLYWWVQEAGIPFLNTNRLFRNAGDESIYIDHNFSMPEGLGVRFAMAFGRKAVHWRGDQLRLTTTEGESVIAASLHLSGRNKMLARDLERRDQIGLKGKSLFLAIGRLGRFVLHRTGLYR